MRRSVHYLARLELVLGLGLEPVLALLRRRDDAARDGATDRDLVRTKLAGPVTLPACGLLLELLLLLLIVVFLPFLLLRRKTSQFAKLLGARTTF